MSATERQNIGDGVKQISYVIMSVDEFKLVCKRSGQVKGKLTYKLAAEAAKLKPLNVINLRLILLRK